MNPEFIVRIIVRARNEIAGVLQKAAGDVDKLTKAQEKGTDAERRRAVATKKTADSIDDVTKRFHTYVDELEKGNRSTDTAAKNLRAFQREFDRLGNRVRPGSEAADTLYKLGRRADDMATRVKKAEQETTKAREQAAQASKKAAAVEVGADNDRATAQRKLQAEIAKTVRAQRDARTEAERAAARDRLHQHAEGLRELGVTEQQVRKSISRAFTDQDDDVAITRRQRRLGELANVQRRLANMPAPRQSFLARLFSADEDRLNSINRHIREFEQSANRGGFSAVRFAGNLRGMVIIGAIAFFEQLIGVGIALGGTLVSIASTAIQAGAALGGALAAGAAQAIPVIGLLAAAWGRVGAVFDVLQKQQQAQLQTAAQSDKQAGKSADAADALASAQDGLKSAQDAVAESHRRVAEAQQGLTKARFDARREIEDLMMAERQAQLQAESAALAQSDAQQALRRSLASGDVDALAQQSLEARSATFDRFRSARELGRATFDAARARRGGVEGRPNVVAARRALADANRGVEQANRGIEAARRGIDSARRSSQEAAQAVNATQQMLNAMLAQLSPAERRLYDALKRVRDRYKQVFTGPGGVIEPIINSFTHAANAAYNLLGDKRLVRQAHSLSQAIGKQLNRITDGLTSRKSLDFFGDMAKEAEHNLPRLVSILGNVAGIAANVARAASPALREFLNYFVQLTQRGQEASGTNSGLARMERFFMKGEEYAESIFNLAGALSQLFLAIIGTSADEGQNAIDRMTAKIREATAWINAHQADVRKFFAEARESTGQIMHVLGTLAKMLFSLFNPEQVDAFAQAFDKTLLPALLDVIKVMGYISRIFFEIASTDVGSGLVRLFIEASLIAKVFGPVLSIFGRLSILLGTLFGRLALVRGGLGLLRIATGPIGLAFGAIAATFLILSGRIHNVGDALKALIPIIAGVAFAFVSRRGLGGALTAFSGLIGGVPGQVRRAVSGGGAIDPVRGPQGASIVAGGAQAAEGAAAGGRFAAFRTAAGGFLRAAAPIALGVSLVNGVIDGITSKRRDFAGKFQDFLHGVTFGIVDGAGPGIEEKTRKEYAERLNAGLRGAAHDVVRGSGFSAVQHVLSTSRPVVTEEGDVFSSSTVKQLDFRGLARQAAEFQKQIAINQRLADDLIETGGAEVAGPYLGRIDRLKERLKEVQGLIEDNLRDAPKWLATWSQRGDFTSLQQLKRLLDQTGEGSANLRTQLEAALRTARGATFRAVTRNLARGAFESVGQIRDAMDEARASMRMRGLKPGDPDFERAQIELARASQANLRRLLRAGVIDQDQYRQQVKKIWTDTQASIGRSLEGAGKAGVRTLEDTMSKWTDAIGRTGKITDKQVKEFIKFLEPMPDEAKKRIAATYVGMLQEMVDKGVITQHEADNFVAQLQSRFYVLGNLDKALKDPLARIATYLKGLNTPLGTLGGNLITLGQQMARAIPDSFMDKLKGILGNLGGIKTLLNQVAPGLGNLIPGAKRIFGGLDTPGNVRDQMHKLDRERAQQKKQHEWSLDDERKYQRDMANLRHRFNVISGRDLQDTVDIWMKGMRGGRQGIARNTQLIISELAEMPKGARRETSEMLLAQTRTLVQQGKLPKGATKDLANAIIARFGDMRSKSIRRAGDMLRAIGPIFSSLAEVAAAAFGNIGDNVTSVLESLGVGKGLKFDIKKPGKFAKSAVVAGVQLFNAVTGNEAGAYHRDAGPSGKVIRVAEGGHDEVVLTTDPKHKRRQQGLLMEYLRKAPHVLDEIRGYARGGYVQGAQEPRGAAGSAIRRLASQLFAKGFNVTSGGEFRGTGTGHDQQWAIDLGNSVNNMQRLWSVVFPLRSRLTELFGPSSTRPGPHLWKNGVSFSDPGLQAEHEDHIHVGMMSGIIKALGKGIGAAGGAIQHIKKMIVTGPDGALKAIGQRAVDRARKAANAYLDKHGGAGGGGAIGANFHGPWVKVMQQIAQKMGWDAGDWRQLIQGESGGDPTAVNPSSGAFGIGQFLGATLRAYAKFGATSHNPADQIRAMAQYIKDRYRNPTRALAAWLSRSPHWYAGGGPVHGPAGHDQVNARLTRGEHVWTAAEVARAGGHKMMFALRKMLGGGGQGGPQGYAAGGTAVVGDSLGVGTVPYLRDLFGRVFANVQVGRSSASGVAALRELLRRHPDFRRILFDLGTNDSSAAQLARSLRIADRISGSTDIFASLVHGPGAAAKNAVLRRLARASDDIHLVHPGRTGLGPDGIHYSAAGYRTRAGRFFKAASAGGGDQSSGGGYQEPTIHGRDVEGVLDEIQKAQREIHRLSEKKLSKKFTDALSKSFRALLGDGGLLDQLGDAVERMTTTLENNLKRATYRINKNGDVIQRLNPAEVADRELKNLVKAYDGLLGQKGAIADSLRDVSRRINRLRRGGISEGESKKADRLEAQIEKIKKGGVDDDEKKRLKRMENRLKELKKHGIDKGERPQFEQLVGIRRNLRDRLSEVRGTIADNLEARFQAAETAVQARLDRVSGRAQRRSDTADRRARRLGILGLDTSPTFARRENALRDQAADLRRARQFALRHGRRDLARDIEGQIKDLQVQILENARDGIQAAVDYAEGRAQRAQSMADIGNRLADLRERAGDSAGAFAQRRAGLVSVGHALATERDAIINARNLAAGRGQLALVEQLNDKLADLDASIQENTAALASNTVQARQAAIDAITNRGGFLGGVYGGLGGLLTALSSNTGANTIAQQLGLLRQSGQTLGQTGGGLRQQLFEAYGIDTRNLSPTDLAQRLSSLNYDNIEANFTTEQRQQFENLITAVIENATALEQNTDAVNQLTHPTTQSWASTAWLWFRNAIFNGSGGLLPRYQIPMMDVGGDILSDGLAFLHSGEKVLAANVARGGRGGDVFAPNLTNIEKTVDMDPETMVNKLYFRWKNRPS